MLNNENVIKVTPEMEMEGARMIQNLCDCSLGMAKDAARELFLAMLDKSPQFGGAAHQHD